MNFLFKAPQILIAEQYEREFDMIFHVKAAQNFASERYGIDFYNFFPHYGGSTLGCRAL